MSNHPPSPGAARRDIALVVAGALLVSMKGIAVKLLYAEGVTPDAALLLRAMLSLPLILAWTLYRRGWLSVSRVPLRHVAGALLAGVICYYGGAWFNFMALTSIDAILERVLLFSYPVIVVVVRAAMRRAWPERRVVGAVAMTYVGIVLAVGGSNVDVLNANGPGALLVMASACTFAYYLFANERIARAIGSAEFIFYTMLGAAVALALHFAAFAHPAELDLSPRGWVLMVLMTLFTNVVPLLLIAESVRRIGAQRAAIISAIGPPATIIAAWFILGETIAGVQFVGAALIVAGIVVLERRRAMTLPAAT